MQQLIICILIGIATTIADPVPSGGANCTSARDCGQIGGTCNYTLINGTVLMRCTCYPEYARPDCSYVRKSKTTAGGLQIGLSFMGIFGSGFLYLGYIDHGISQLLLGLIYWGFIIGLHVTGCCTVCGISNIKGIEGGPLVICIWCTVMIMIFLPGLVWSVVDGAMIFGGRYPADPNGFFLV